MADTIGRAIVETTLDFDSTRVRPAAAKATKAAGKAGEAAGEEYNDGFTTKYEKDFDKKTVPKVEKKIDSLKKKVAKKGEETGDKFGDGFWKGARKNLGKPFDFLDQQAKAIALILVASFGEVATLFSGLSASALALGGSLVTAASALGVMAGLLPALGYGIGLAVSGLGRVKELAPEAAKGIENLKNAFSEADVPRFMAEWEESLARFTNVLANSLRFDHIAEGLGQATAQITDAFTAVLESPAWTGFVGAMETLLPKSLAAVGMGLAGITSAILDIITAAAPAIAVMSGQFRQWGEGIAEAAAAARADGGLQRFFLDGAVSLGLLLDLVGDLGAALFSVLTQGQDQGDTLLQIFGDLAARFREWVNSGPGMATLNAFFDQGLVIMQALLPLVGAVGTALGVLVTPELVNQLVTLLGGLTLFVPILGQVLGLVSQLNILGIISALLTAIGDALTPVMPQLQELATVLGEALIVAIQGLSPLMGAIVQVVASLIPVVVALLPVVADLIAELGGELAKVLIDLAPVILDVANELIPLIPMIADALIPIIQSLAVNLGPIIALMGTILPPILALVVTLIRPMVSIFTLLAESVLPKVNSIMQFTTDSIKALKPVVDAVTDVIRGIVGPFETFINKLRDGSSWADAMGAAIESAANFIKTAVSRIKTALGSIKWPTPPSWVTNGISKLPGFATGGLVTGPTRALIGEAGPEMVVPLARPLSQVDPAVRDVAAFAQGKMPAMASGGIGGGNIEAGAITVVTPYANPELVAEAVMDALALQAK